MERPFGGEEPLRGSCRELIIPVLRRQTPTMPDFKISPNMCLDLLLASDYLDT